MLARNSFAPAFVFVVGLTTILAAWAFQIWGGYVPCKLCLEQRLPYYVGLPVAFVALANVWAGGPAWLTRLALGLAGVVFIYGAYLGAFHAGVEWKWWEGPSDCGSGGDLTTSTGSGGILDQLDNIKIVSCTEASWRFPAGWGLSFAGWNAAVSAVLAVVAVFGTVRKSR